MDQASPKQLVEETPLPSSLTSRRSSEVKAKEGERTPSNRASWVVLVVLLTFAPFAFGAVEFWSIAVVELVALILGVAWVTGGIRRRAIRLEFNILVFAAIGLQVWIAVQMAFGWTLDRASTRDGLVLLFSYFLVFLVVQNEHWSARWIQRLAIAVTTICFFVAAFGIIQFFSWNGRLYWVRPIWLGTPFGPYVNKNHFAGLMEMAFPVALSLVFSRGLEKIWKALLFFFSVVMALAIFLSLSRAGMLSFTLSLIAFIYLSSRKRGMKPVMITAGLVAALAVIWLVSVGIEPLFQRILTLHGFNQEASFLDRIRMAGDTLRIIRDHPYRGTGFGTFALATPGYTSWYTEYVIDKAHNDYLQLLSEVGLVGFCFAVFWLVGFFRSVLLMVRDSSLPFSTLRLGAFCGCLALLIHSLVDFNLQIPANAIYFSVLAALATRGDIGRVSQAQVQAHDARRSSGRG